MATSATASVPAPGSKGTVVVYESGGASAATARAVAALQGAGYAVLHTRSVNYHVPGTTVFYETGQQAAAQALVNAHIGVLYAQRLPSVFARSGTLAVIVTSGYVS